MQKMIYFFFMIILYTLPTCPFCATVRDELGKLGISFDERDINEEAHLAELLSKGRKRQVPFLVDDSTNTSMYESSDIVNYLKETYGENSKPN